MWRCKMTNPKILVIQMKFIGDVLASSIICNNLKEKYPQSQIDYLIYPFTKPVIENNPNIDNIIYFEEKYRKSKKELLKFLFGIRKNNYDIVIDAYGKIESNLVTLFSNAKRKISYYKSYTSFLYSDTVKIIKEPKTNAGTSLENRLNLLSPLGFKGDLDNKPVIFLTQNEIKNGENIISKFTSIDKRPIFMISVLGSSLEKTYPFSYMAKILDEIVEKTSATLIFNYMKSQSNEAQEIYRLCNKSTQKNILIDLIPGSLREFMAITKNCYALIGNEGGAVNMAKALDIPTFTIFSPWINKYDWNCFEDGKNNISVHLEDYKPEIYQGKEKKYLKKDAENLYKQFTPELLFKELDVFLKPFTKISL